MFFSLLQERPFDFNDVAQITYYHIGDSWRATEPLSVSGMRAHVGNRGPAKQALAKAKEMLEEEDYADVLYQLEK